MSRVIEAIAPLGKGIGLLILLFVGIYAPVSAATGHLPLKVSVPLTIVLSLGIAVGMIAFFIRARGMSIAAFGLRLCSSKYAAFALIVGLPLGVIVSWLTSHAQETGPLAGLSIPVWLSILYFGFATPIQEEVIFRGLLQSVLTRSFSSLPASTYTAPVIVAILFGAIHLVVGPVTALCAFALGMVAGELRLRSGSLVPAVVVHALFNLCGILWALSGTGT